MKFAQEHLTRFADAMDAELPASVSLMLVEVETSGHQAHLSFERALTARRRDLGHDAPFRRRGETPR